ncbi:DUF7409 domain-containing protein [Halogeometricum limi]|uniref:Helix-hairpin-helix domain n=1 Tax=Halogeometricum limi TaxID=555875 RepID=A0A1I6GIF9_9EURY|nr:helix-hairpin-helix domain-containing protein [Halogeometricum limi]SFR41966.1 Helix-hairpin-helix domain [Halogeometricum limi]
MNEGTDDEEGVDDAGDVEASWDRGDEDVREAGDGDAPDSWSAAAPTESDGEIPLPWTVVDDEELREERPEAFEELRFVGPKTAAALRDSSIDVDDISRKRVSYRDLTEHGVHPGVAAKIRREHSLSWSFDAEDSDLSRRSSQVRGLDDDERAWVAASSGWADESESEAAETDGSGDATTAESAWQQRGPDAPKTNAPNGAGTSEADAEAEWRTAAATTATDSPTRDEEAAWRARSPDVESGDDETAGEAAWRERATDHGIEDDAREETDAEAAWRAQSAPTPVTDLDDVDEAYADRLGEAGIRSVRRLATADPESVADALELDRSLVERWCEAARARFE